MVRPVAVSDTSFLRWILQPKMGNGLIPDGIWSIMPSGDSSDQLIVFRNGTEYHRYDSLMTKKIREADPDFFSLALSTHEPAWRPALQEQKPGWDWIRTESFERIDGRWFQQSEGIEAGRGFDAQRAERWWQRNRYWIGISKIVRDQARVSFSLTAYTDYMNLQREMRKEYGNTNFSDYSWEVSASFRGLTYSMQSTPWVLPEYFVLENRPDSLWEFAKNNRAEKAGGDVISIFENGVGAGYSSNVTHKLELRLWYARYQILIDADLYTAPVHRIALEDIPSGFGHWGAYAVGCNGLWMPGLWIEGGPAFRYIAPWKRYNSLEWFPVRFDLMFGNTTHFRFGLSTRFRMGGRSYEE
jgi:hypothetical protein